LSLTLTWLAAAPLVVAQEKPPVSISRTKPDGTPNRAAWMAEGSFGVMTHYLPTPPPGSQAERQAWLDRTVDAFDLPSYMRRFDETGADWLTFTIIQNNGAFLSPNPVILPQAELLMSRRDLVLELAQQLQKRGKRLIIYMPSDIETSISGRSGVKLEAGQPEFARRGGIHPLTVWTWFGVEGAVAAGSEFEHLQELRDVDVFRCEAAA